MSGSGGALLAWSGSFIMIFATKAKGTLPRQAAAIALTRIKEARGELAHFSRPPIRAWRRIQPAFLPKG
ncbi:hypothetical protein [Mesorhizobium sp. KR2-14]|uniref:hypothetical protein n=1 Tax=Mesorhizobium sp. KR2-14 TaxID=3156610 RepID=UPI0032B59EA0